MCYDFLPTKSEFWPDGQTECNAYEPIRIQINCDYFCIYHFIPKQSSKIPPKPYSNLTCVLHVQGQQTDSTTVNQLYLAAIKFGVWTKVDLFGAL